MIVRTAEGGLANGLCCRLLPFRLPAALHLATSALVLPLSFCQLRHTGTGLPSRHPSKSSYLYLKIMVMSCNRLHASSFVLFLQTTSTFTGPDIRLSIFLSNVPSAFSVLLLRIYTSDVHNSIGTSGVLYRRFFVALDSNLDSNPFES